MTGEAGIGKTTLVAGALRDPAPATGARLGIPPGPDGEAAPPLRHSRNRHNKLCESPKVAATVRTFQAKLAQALEQKRAELESLPFGEELPQTWRDHFEKLRNSTATSRAPSIS